MSITHITPSSLVTAESLERHRRTLVKTVLYRLFMILVTILVAFVITGNAGDSINIGIAANLIKTGTYYCYERIWVHIAWGR